jgi:hypothetical protein
MPISAKPAPSGICARVEPVVAGTGLARPVAQQREEPMKFVLTGLHP